MFTKEQMRAEFERELIDNHNYVPSDFSYSAEHNTYTGDDDYIQFGWDLWQAARSAQAVQVPLDPMDWPLPCDVTVGHGTMRKGVKLRTLILRMKALYKMATGNDADEVAARTVEVRRQLFEDFKHTIAAAPQQPEGGTHAN